MIRGQNGDVRASSAISAARRPKLHTGAWFWLLGWLFPRNAATDVVATSFRIHASPETVWQRMLLYEDVPLHPPLLLRLLLPRPVRTKGDKTSVGSAVQCTYNGGHLVKRILAVDPPHLLQFEVIEQRLGIEGCVTTLGGSYQFRPCGDQTQIVLTTNYRGHLRPRFFWRSLERLLARRLHRHVLDGMRVSLPRSGPSTHPAFAECSNLECIPPQ